MSKEIISRLDEIKNNVLSLLGGLCIIGLIISPVIIMLLLSLGINSYKCYVYESKSGFETEYKITSGCWLDKEGRWVLYEEHLREITAKDLKGD